MTTATRRAHVLVKRRKTTTWREVSGETWLEIRKRALTGQRGGRILRIREVHMSWTATGTVEGKGGEVGMWGDDLTFSPARSDLNPEAKKQTDYLIDAIGMAFEAGVLDGKYSVSANGHADAEGNGRKSLAVSFSAIP